MTAPTGKDTHPKVLTVEEAASLLRITRNGAYAIVRQWRASGGRQGLPCVEIGRTRPVPRAGFDALCHGTDVA